MGVKWTKQQQQVIDLRDRNILVSAAAGSGKTAVLVERIITMLTDEEHPVNVDELLIVTFTEAAAGEMKERMQEERIRGKRSAVKGATGIRATEEGAAGKQVAVGYHLALAAETPLAGLGLCLGADGMMGVGWFAIGLVSASFRLAGRAMNGPTLVFFGRMASCPVSVIFGRPGIGFMRAGWAMGFLGRE